MKTMMIAIAIAFSGLATTGSAFAQNTDQAQAPAPAPTTVTQMAQWVPPAGQAAAPITRAEVYQDLVKSEQDGQLDNLNRTLYWHH